MRGGARSQKVFPVSQLRLINSRKLDGPNAESVVVVVLVRGIIGMASRNIKEL
jgi:hypothetical protein